MAELQIFFRGKPQGENDPRTDSPAQNFSSQLFPAFSVFKSMSRNYQDSARFTKRDFLLAQFSDWGQLQFAKLNLRPLGLEGNTSFGCSAF